MHSHIRDVLVFAEFFPSRIQPWLLDSIEQIILHGGQPWIFASESSGTSWPSKVFEHNLPRQTCYIDARSAAGVLRSLTNAVGFRSWRSAATCRGLVRLIKSRQLPLRPVRPWAAAIAAAPAMGLSRADVIHAHAMVPAYQFRHVSKVLDIPLVMTFHGLPPEGVGVLEERKREELFSVSDRVLVNTKFAQRQLESLGCPADRITIIPQGIDIASFPFRPTTFEGTRPVRVLTVGRLHRDKGHQFAIGAIRELLSSGYDVEYRIAGVGPLLPEIESIAREHDLHGRVTVLGELNDEELRKEYDQADIFLLPSLRDRTGFHEETQGVVIQEAQASGCLVIATIAGGIPECVDDGQSAWLVPDRNSSAIAEKIRHLVDQPGRWPSWQKNARDWVESRFDINTVGDQVWSVYEDVARRSVPSG